MAKVSIITPWLNCPELIVTYERSTSGAEVVVIDNGSAPETAVRLEAMCHRTNGIYIRNNNNARYATANNQGMAAATGDILIFLNNDIEAPGAWLTEVERQVKHGALYGPSLLTRWINGRPLPYLEGFCIAGTRETWDRLGGWDAESYQGMYWEDNDVCYRAQRLSIKLVETTWPVWHFGNYTSANTPGAYDNSMTNAATFEAKVIGNV